MSSDQRVIGELTHWSDRQRRIGKSTDFIVLWCRVKLHPLSSYQVTSHYIKSNARGREKKSRSRETTYYLACLSTLDWSSLTSINIPRYPYHEQKTAQTQTTLPMLRNSFFTSLAADDVWERTDTIQGNIRTYIILRNARPAVCGWGTQSYVRV